MDMTALQRSTTSFRRQGSSGLIWDDKFLSGELKTTTTNKDHVPGGGSDAVMRRSRSDGGKHMYRTPVKAEFVGSDADPPSPKVRACGFCSVFGKPKGAPAGKGSSKKQNRPARKS